MYISTKKVKKQKIHGKYERVLFYRVLFCKLQSRCLDIAERSLSQLLATCILAMRNTRWEWTNHPKVLSLPILEEERWLNEERIRLEEKEPR